MQRLVRSALGLCALGLAMIGCNRSGSSDPGEPSKDPGSSPYQVTFRVPGMS